jgi:hypothetical protein
MPMPYVTVRADRSASSSARSSCTGNRRGGGGCTTSGGRQPGGGGVLGGGPAYGGGVGRPGGRRKVSSEAPAPPGAGRCQNPSSSGLPVGELTPSDATPVHRDG